MKKFYTLISLCIPICLIVGLGILQPIGVTGQEEQQALRPEYHQETDHISMIKVGKILEQFGKEIQKNSSVTIGGKTYPVTGNGYLEFHVMPARRGEGTNIHFEIGSGQMETPTRGKTYVSYDRGVGREVKSTELTEILDKVGETLANKGAFVMDDYSVPLEGTASVELRLMERAKAPRPGRRPYGIIFSIEWGKKKFPVPEDEEDMVEAEKRGDIKELAKQELKDADNKAIAKLFESLSSGLKAGKIKVGDKALEVGDTIGRGGISHLIATDGSSQRIQVYFRFGKATPREKRTGPRYSEEFFDEPMKKVGALLKRLGTEILEVGTIKFGDNEFKVRKMATYEIKASDRGFSIELRYTEPDKE